MAVIERWRIRSQFVGDDAWTHEAIVSGPPTPRDEFVDVVRADLYARAVEALYSAHDFISRVLKWEGDDNTEQSELLAEIAKHLGGHA